MTKTIPPFVEFSKPIHDRFVELSKNELFVTVDPDALWELYLASFPEGTNPIYKTRTEHDCSCCKNFIRNIGNVVAYIDGKIQTIWDVKGLPYPYKEVAEALHQFVSTSEITGLFRKSEKTYGAEKSNQLVDGKVIRWNHFYATVANKHYTKSVGEVVGEYNNVVGVFKRGLEELSKTAFQDVLDLIEQKAIYRGEEHLSSIKGFKKMQDAYNKLKTKNEKNNFVWANSCSPFARFRNTVIGTLLVDISSGMDFDAAVRSFESKVAPANYKRPTALITPRMVEDAMKTINQLGIQSSLSRRMAKISDISVNNVLWVNNATKAKMRDGIENLLLAETKAPTKKSQTEKAEEISIDDFMKNILPTVSSMEVMIKNSQMGNFVTLTAPKEEDSENLFKWDNKFAWSYDGNVTDSIKEKVKRAGGNVTNAKMRISLAWFNFDDLDIHITEPNGNEICFYNKCNKLDVDMNNGGRMSQEPVENVSWTSVADGLYKVHVNQYNRRETTKVGCVIEIENNGSIVQLTHAKAMSGKTLIATVKVSNGNIIEIKPASKEIVGGGFTQEKWGVKTETFVPVSTVMFSPNYWDDNKIGNKHHFFILDGCKADEKARGFYNEFLRSDLEKHRKVFEVLADKTKCEIEEEQLSGIGFSSTMNESLVVRVSGKKLQKTFNVSF